MVAASKRVGAGLSASPGKDVNGFLCWRDFGKGHDVPVVQGNDVSGKNVEVIGIEVPGVASACIEEVVAIKLAPHGPDLNTQHASVPFGDEVEWRAVTPGFADGESEGEQVVLEDRFGPCAFVFGVGFLNEMESAKAFRRFDGLQ